MSPKREKYVYYFGGDQADGNGSMKELLGGKGANLGEMVSIGIPVPAGFTITTEVCTFFMRNKRKYPEGLEAQVDKSLRKMEKEMGAKFGDAKNPLLVSVRSGARSSMPGMMETVLNVGLNNRTREGLIAKTGNPRFVYDAQRRLIQMYSDVVMEKAADIEPKDGEGIRVQLEHEMEKMKKARGVTEDTQLTAEDLKELIEIYKAKVKKVLGKPFPEDPMEQLWGGVGAVFQSWNGKRACSYRRIEGIPDEWGTAVNVQAMVFGNMGDSSATGVGFSRDASTGRNIFYGEWLPNAQGEDVVAGIRTPYAINKIMRKEAIARAAESNDPKMVEQADHPSLEEAMPKLYKQLDGIRAKLEKHYRDMQDIEFTIQEGRLWMLQCRVGKRNGRAAVIMAMDMLKEKLITLEEAVLRVTADQLNEWLLPILDPIGEKKHQAIVKGLPAGPGGATGRIVFTAADAVAWANDKSKSKEDQRVILVREETNPEDVEGMRAAEAILTARGGMTSHAALVARGWGKCCIVGAGKLKINLKNRTMKIEGSDKVYQEGDWISLNGSKGAVYEDRLPLVPPDPEDKTFVAFLILCDKLRQINVRTNADTPADAKVARIFGAEGIGLFRIEHMFYGEGSDEPLFLLRKMIMSNTQEERRQVLKELYPFMKKDIKSTLEAMSPYPVTIRLLDPPLHEFVPTGPKAQKELAEALGIDAEELERRSKALHEVNPMMGHRGVRLGITYPEVAEMQMRAILESAVELTKKKKKVLPEIMIPVTCVKNELDHQKAICDKVVEDLKKKHNVRKIDFLFGTMIEIPRAALTANKMAETAEFFSFGTNDLTQMGFGFSRDDTGGFLPDYLEQKLLPADPFETIDQEAIGELIAIGVERGRRTRPDLKVGICGEHGGELKSVIFCHHLGMDYVSCSPFRVPIARLALAQATVKHGKPGGFFAPEASNNTAEAKPAAKRGRGRPRKSAPEPAPAHTAEAKPATKRGRGRPRKSVPEPAPAHTAAPKRRGRPPKK